MYAACIEAEPLVVDAYVTEHVRIAVSPDVVQADELRLPTPPVAIVNATVPLAPDFVPVASMSVTVAVIRDVSPPAVILVGSAATVVVVNLVPTVTVASTDVWLVA